MTFVRSRTHMSITIDCIRRLRDRSRAPWAPATALAVAALVAARGHAGAQTGSARRGEASVAASGRTIPGVAYTIRVTSAPVSGATTLPGVPTDSERYVGHAVFAAHRGRMDILEGAAEPLLARGDYVLFDTGQLVIVHPSTHEFVVMPTDTGSVSLERLRALGVDVTLTDVKVALDSLGPSDTIAGFPTLHFRMTTGFDLSLQSPIMAQRLGTESTTDYWIARVPGLPNNPLLRANGFQGTQFLTGLFGDLERRVDSASARMGTAVALRTRTVSRLLAGPGTNATTRQTSDVSDIAHESVNEDLLILPADYRARPLPGMPDPPPDAGAKWRLPPVGR